MFIPKAVGQMETPYYFDVINDSLTCQVRYLDSVTLKPTGPLTFEKDKWKIMEFDSNYKGFTLNDGRVKNIDFKRTNN